MHLYLYFGQNSKWNSFMPTAWAAFLNSFAEFPLDIVSSPIAVICWWAAEGGRAAIDAFFHWKNKTLILKFIHGLKPMGFFHGRALTTQAHFLGRSGYKYNENQSENTVFSSCHGYFAETMAKPKVFRQYIDVCSPVLPGSRAERL